MPIIAFPTQTDGSLGRSKTDDPTIAITNLDHQVPADEHNNKVLSILELYAEVGLTDGSTPGSLRAAILALDLQAVAEAGAAIVNTPVSITQSTDTTPFSVTKSGAGSNPAIEASVSGFAQSDPIVATAPNGRGILLSDGSGGGMRVDSLGQLTSIGKDLWAQPYPQQTVDTAGHNARLTGGDANNNANGGNALMTGGSADASGNGGDAILRGGAGAGAGNDGRVIIGDQFTSEIQSGDGATPWNHSGTLAVNSNDVLTDQTGAPIRPQIATAGANDTMTSTDANRIYRCPEVATIITVPTGLTNGTTTEYINEGGTLVISPDTGMTLVYPATFLPEANEVNSSIVVTIIATDRALVRGDLKAA
jgi:hypothetical protein